MVVVGGGEGGGGRGLSKNVGHGWPTTKNLKKNTGENVLKQSPKMKFGPKFLFLKVLFWAYNVFIFVHMFQWISSEMFFNFQIF